MTNPTDQQAADALLAILPDKAKDKLKAVYREHGKNRKSQRASRAIIRHALSQVRFENERTEARAAARQERAIAQAMRLDRRVERGVPGALPGMTPERFQVLLAIDLPGAVAESERGG